MIKSSAHSSTFLAGNLTNRVFPLASYSAAFARQSNPSFVLQRWRRRRRRRRLSASSCYTCAACCVLASFMLHPSSCAAFPFDALHVDCFAILRLQIHRQLLVVAPCCCCCWGVHWLDRNRSGQRRVVSGSRELLRRCTASVVAFKPQRSRMFGRKLAVRVLAWRLWLS